MARFSFALAGVSALAIAALPAVAQAQGMAPVHAIVSGGYTTMEIPGPNRDAWSGVAGLVYNGAEGFGVEGVVGFAASDVGGFDIDGWTVGGGAFYRTAQYAFGGGVQYQSTDLGPDRHSTSYGVVGEYYVSDMVTLGASGSGYSGSFNSDGYVLAASGAIYPMANFALIGVVAYDDADGPGHETTLGLGGEFLPMSTIPVSINAGYNRLTQSEVNVWKIGLTAYLGTPGDGTLRSNHRHGGVALANGVSLNN